MVKFGKSAFNKDYQPKLIMVSGVHAVPDQTLLGVLVRELGGKEAIKESLAAAILLAVVLRR